MRWLKRDDEQPRPSVLTLISRDATVVDGKMVGIRRVVLPPNATVRFGDHEIHIPAGQAKAVLWGGDYELVNDTLTSAS